MITHEEYKSALCVVMQYRQQCVDNIAEIDKEIDVDFGIRNTALNNTDLSVRAMNLLFYSDLGLRPFTSLVKDLSNVSRTKLMGLRCMGRKTLREIDELCEYANIKMLP